MNVRPAYPFFSVAASSPAEKRCFLDRVIPALAERGIRAALLSAEYHFPAESELAPYAALFAGLTTGGEIGSLVYERARRSDIVFHFADDISHREAGSSVQLEAAGFLENFEQEFARLLRGAEQIVAERPVWGCILIGGKSSRMGSPKHLLTADDGSTWLERSVGLLKGLTEGVVLSGRGEIPHALTDLPRLPDIPGMQGPLSGMTAAARWQPDVAWLVIACDMPGVTEESVTWLLENRRLGSWGIVPRTAAGDRLEPLFALYEPQAGSLFESMHRNRTYRLSAITACDKVDVVDIPNYIHRAWENVNTPDELKKYRGAG